jgi:hypothetical protein
VIATASRRNVVVAAAAGVAVAITCYMAGPVVATVVSGLAGGVLTLVWRTVAPLVPVLRLMNRSTAWGPRG